MDKPRRFFTPSSFVDTFTKKKVCVVKWSFDCTLPTPLPLLQLCQSSLRLFVVLVYCYICVKLFPRLYTPSNENGDLFYCVFVILYSLYIPLNLEILIPILILLHQCMKIWLLSITIGLVSQAIFAPLYAIHTGKKGLRMSPEIKFKI